ncbi:TonB-dependent receptor [Sphingobium sp. H39-3-25]|uniref:TonB-dependent receptor n=1 Tax=Sphingobium arseniciresistens TaxID=3030834 RepID=UPI0023B99C9B|nr:TonB-dependent receptor [Sphingobium arseniciresistens]
MKTLRAAMLCGTMAAMPLQAQVQPADDAESGPNGAGGSIVVTARLRAEDVQKVPASVSVVDGDTIKNTYTVNTNQLSQLVPALNYSSANPRNTAFTIRGLGSSVVAVSQANDGLEAGVGFYVDGVYHARPATAAFDFTDIERVEVLRGPQGTLFGKNTTAGAINIVSKKPSFDFGAEAELSYGSRDFWQAKAAVTGPIAGDVLAFRLSGSVTRQDGYLKNIARDEMQNDVHNDAVRGQLLYQPSSDFSLRLIGDWSNFRNNCCGQVFVQVAPTLKPAAQQYASLAANAPGGAYAPPSTNPYDRITDNDAALGVDTQEGGASATAEWKTGGVVLTSISAWRFWKWDAANDRDYTGLHIQTTQHIPSRQDQYSQEFRIASAEPGKVEYVAGLYYFQQKIVGHPISIYGPLATYWLLPAGRPANLLDGYQTDGTTDFRTRSYGIFGEVTWRPADRLAITGGVRYTYEEKDGVYDVTAFGGLSTGLTAALIADKNSILRSQFYNAHLGDGSASGRVNISYELTDGVMAYASGAKGQKSGGINMSGLPVYPAGVAGHASGDPILSTVTVRPEKNTTFEAGVKTSFMGGALTFNIDAYHTKVKDFQANVVDSAAVIALRSYLANIPEVTVKGIEFDAAARAGDHLTLRAAGAYSKGTYTDYPAGPCPIESTGTGTAACDLTGQRMPGLPRWAGSAGGELHAPIAFGGGGGEAFLRADAITRTKTSDASGSAYTIIKGYTLVNGALGYRTPRWEVAVFARNLFNKDYMQNLTVQAGNSGLIVGTPSDPRTIGLTLRTKWGQ